jgi:exodeoxyribonuclease VII small subunit
MAEAPTPQNGQAPTGASASVEDGIDGLTYEEAREQLVAVVSRLEAGGVSLEESLALWERGEALARRCEEWLEGARQRLDAARRPQDEG